MTEAHVVDGIRTPIGRYGDADVVVAGGPRFAPPATLREEVAAGERARTSGRGLYPW